MKSFLASIIFGLIFFYFLDIALRVDNLTMEMLIHNLIRFFVGFIFIGIWVWYKHALRFKVSLYIILGFLATDALIDYVRNIDNLNFVMYIHDMFMILWGSINGFFSIRYFHLNDK